jgi:hypothetical protein
MAPNIIVPLYNLNLAAGFYYPEYWLQKLFPVMKVSAATED